MNNPGPFFNPFIGFQNYEQIENNYDKLVNKVNRLEKDIRILESRINKLDKKDIKIVPNEDPQDMYMI